MKPDPIVEEVREIRGKIWDECDGDLNNLIQYYRTAQEKYRDRIITKEELDRQRKLENKNAG
ncbi:MAG: hypothetical protein IH991_05545 [Planctomycetes bacterium]|nr:hypothetical protein [Planctomycetota bacterium]